MKKLLPVVFFIIAAFICLTPILFKPNEGTASSVKDSSLEVRDALWKEYNLKNRINPKIECGDEVKLDSENYDQEKLLKYYNKHCPVENKLSDGGICWASAATSVLKYNGVEGSEYEICYDLIEYAYSMNWCSYDSTGVKIKYMDSLITHEFEAKSMNKKGNNDRYDIYKTLKKEVDNNRVVIFHIDNHSMCGCGYTTFKISYEEKTCGRISKKNINKDYVICNSTWEHSENYSYFPEDEIGTNVFTRWDFGITKIVDKK